MPVILPNPTCDCSMCECCTDGRISNAAITLSDVVNGALDPCFACSAVNGTYNIPLTPFTDCSWSGVKCFPISGGGCHCDSQELVLRIQYSASIYCEQFADTQFSAGVLLDLACGNSSTCTLTGGTIWHYTAQGATRFITTDQNPTDCKTLGSGTYNPLIQNQSCTRPTVSVVLS